MGDVSSRLAQCSRSERCSNLKQCPIDAASPEIYREQIIHETTETRSTTSYVGYKPLPPSRFIEAVPCLPEVARSSLHRHSSRLSTGPLPECEHHTYEYYYSFSIPEDIYGAAILSIVREVAAVSQSSTVTPLVIARGMFAFAMLIFNFGLQVAVIYFTHSYVVQPAVRRVQIKYHDFHTEIFSVSGHFNATRWLNYIGKDDLCQIAMTSNLFYYVLTLLWTFSMMNELRMCENFFSNIYSIPTAGNGQQMFTNDDPPHICGLTRLTRALLYMLVCAPKLAISICLLWVGLRWLSATTSFGDLVLNCVALEFVIRISSLVYNACLPEVFRREVADVDFYFRDAPKSRQQMIMDQCRSYGWSACYLALGIGVVYGWTFWLQDVLPPGIDDVRLHCRKHLEEQVPICSRQDLAFASRCFPFGQ